jgi:hypothetical protein
MKIAIWGSYEHGNFGDDLMAIIFAEALKKEGCFPIIYRLNEKIANRFNVDTTNDLTELFSGVSFAIVGGGGMLVIDNSFRRYFSKVAWQFESDFKKLYEALKYLNVELIPLSIGGNGESGSNTNLPKYRSKVFSEMVTRGTLRLEGDLPLAKKLNINTQCIPDILLTTSSTFPVVKKKSSLIKKIGINLVGVSSSKLSGLLESLAVNNENIEIVFINTHLEEYGHDYELTKKVHTSERISDFCHTDDFMRTFNLLSSLDLLISSKLHLGLTAMTYRTPFISYNGKKKTNSYLNSVSQEKTIYYDGDESEIIQKINSESFFDFDSLFNVPLFETFSLRANEHFNYLSNIVSEYRIK